MRMGVFFSFYRKPYEISLQNGFAAFGTGIIFFLFQLLCDAEITTGVTADFRSMWVVHRRCPADAALIGGQIRICSDRLMKELLNSTKVNQRSEKEQKLRQTLPHELTIHKVERDTTRTIWSDGLHRKPQQSLS